MAGNGSRFTAQGYPHPKPFIDVNGKPMIKRVVESLLLFEHEHIFIGKAEHLAYYDMDAIFPHLKFRTLPLYYTTEGAALTVRQAETFFGADDDILIVNSDQLFQYNNHELEEVRNSGVDGCIWCFKGSGPNWSYAKLDDNGYVTKVAEKEQISEYATGGMYYWKSFHNFRRCVDRMVTANDRTNNEFYVAPVYNHMLEDEKVIIKLLDDIDQLGTPEELRAYENKIRLP
jgi:NDP-sugar pyrophosphorylase family protein